MPEVNLKWNDSGQLVPESDDDVSSQYLLSRQVAHEYHDSAVQTYLDAESAAQQVAAQAAIEESKKTLGLKRSNQAEIDARVEAGQAAFRQFQETQAGIPTGGTGSVSPQAGATVAPSGGGGGWGGEAMPGPAAMPTTAKRAQQAQTGLEDPMIDPTMAFGMGAGLAFQFSRAAGAALMPSLERAIASGVVNVASDVAVGQAAESVGATNPELALPMALALGLFSGATLEPAIERGIVRAAQAAGRALKPEQLAEQVQMMKGILANEAGTIGNRAAADMAQAELSKLTPDQQADKILSTFPEDEIRKAYESADDAGKAAMRQNVIAGRQAVIEEISAEIGNRPLDEALKILKSQKGEVTIRPGAQSVDIKTKIQQAYNDAQTKSGGTSVDISVLRDNLKISQAKMSALLRKASVNGDAVMALGEPSVVNDYLKGGMVDGNLLVRLEPSFFDNIDKYLTPAVRSKLDAAIEPSKVRGGGGKSGIPAADMQTKIDEFTANKSPDITKEYAGGGNIRLWGGADLEPKFLGQINTPEDIMRVISGTDETFNAEREVARRGKQSWADTEAAGKQYRLEDILGRRLGQALNAEQVDNARAMLVSSADSLRGMSQKVMMGQANDLEKADFMRAFNLHYAIQMQLSGAAAEAGRALQIFRKVAQADTMRVGQIQEFLQASAGRVKPEDLAAAISSMETPAQVANFVKQAKRATTYDMFMEAWINGLLSGPVTHSVNTLSNVLTSVWMVPERALAAGLSRLHGGEIRGGEVAAQSFGLVQGFKDGLKLAAEAFRKGESSDLMGKVEQAQQRAITAENMAQLPVIKKLAPNAFQEGGVAAQAVDLLGNMIRLPGRFLTAEDELFKSVGYRMELQAQAYRKAASEGLEGPAMAQRIREIIADPQNLAPEVHSAAIDAARYQTFTKELGTGGQAIQRAANAIPGVKMVVPFIRTPANIMKFAFERTPLAPLMRQVRDDIAAGGARRDMALARMSLGSMAMATVAAYAADGTITGGGPSDTGLRSAKYNTGWQPYSIKIGDTYYAYGRLEPLGMMMGLAADAVEIMGELNEVESDKVATTIVAAIAKNVMSKTWLRGLSDVIMAMEDPDRYGPNYIKSLAGTAVPTGVAQVERTLSPEIADAQTALDAIKARVPGYSKELPVRRNLWGEAITFNGALGPDLISPIFTSKIKDSPIDKELLRMRAPIRMPSRSQSLEGVPIKLDPFEYEEFLLRMNRVELESTGKNLKKSLNELVSKNPDYKEVKNDDIKERMIRSYIQEATDKARQQMLDESPILRRMVDREHAKQAESMQ